jgi:N-acetylglutamate synthase-like GNAT family acetyltransferase
MRFVFAAVACAVLFVSAAHAEKRVFIIANSADGYGIDRCLANGSRCGSAAAHAYCKSREFVQAVSFHKIDKDDITGAIPTEGNICQNGQCEQFVAIECTR